jgi:hypothetical protein
MPDDPQVPEKQWTEHIDPERRSMDSETRYHRQYTVFDSGDAAEALRIATGFTEPLPVMIADVFPDSSLQTPPGCRSYGSDGMA